MIRIKGIVKTANQVRNKLQQGIHPQEVDDFKTYVSNSLTIIENICKDAKTTPDRLPTPSRKAYYYLKSIDSDRLPITDRQHITPPIQTLRIKNVLKQQKNIQQQIIQLSLNSTPAKRQSLSQTLSNCTQEIEKICQQNQVTPAALTTPSRKAYAWMKFLTDSNNLKLHLDTLKKIQAIAQTTIQTKQLNIEQITVEIISYNGLYKYKKHPNGNINLQLSEGFIQAEDNILQTIIRMVLLGDNPKDKQILRAFGLTEEYSDVIIEMDLIADVDAETPQGSCYNLDSLFHRLNEEYFAGKMEKPRLTWNQILTKRKLGHYERIRDRVVMSRTLDDSRVPQIVVEFVLYHELLHKHHGIKWVNGKRMVHTPEFRRSERQFKYYTDVNQWLKQSPVLSM